MEPQNTSNIPVATASKPVSNFELTRTELEMLMQARLPAGQDARATLNALLQRAELEICPAMEGDYFATSAKNQGRAYELFERFASEWHEHVGKAPVVFRYFGPMPRY